MSVKRNAVNLGKQSYLMIKQVFHYLNFARVGGFHMQGT